MAWAIEAVVPWLEALSGLIALAFAAIIWRANPRGRRNRHLALLLVAEALFQGTLAVSTWSGNEAAALIGPWFALVLLSIAYLLFGTTLEGRMARALSGRAARGALIAVCLGVLAIALEQTRRILGSGGTIHDVDDAIGWPWLLFAAASLFCLTLSIGAYRATPPASPTRRRARAYALAFGMRDSLYAGAVLWWSVATFGLHSTPAANVAIVVASLTTPIFVGLLAYGILSTQLFDIDMRIKWGISRGTVASFALAVVFVVSKIVEVYASRTGGFIAGAVAAGLLMFAAPRLNKLGDKVANTAMPSVQPTTEYVAYKKLEVYRAAVESALQDDRLIDRAERAMLDRLRVKLGLSEADANALESELLAAG